VSTSAARQKRGRRWLALGALALFMSAFFWWPVIALYPNTQSGDGPPYYKTLEAARVSLVRYHELPLWNPYECGGLPLWDNPQSPVGAPLVLPMFFLGTTATMLLWYVLHSAIGFMCMWLFARMELRLSRAATFVASCVWAFNGFHQQHYSGGHFTFVPFLYFPLAILLWRRAERDDRMAVGLGALVAWMFWEGGVYPLPHLGLILAAETLTRAWPPRRLGPIVRAAVIVGAMGFLLAASRMLPVVDQLRSHSRSLGVETERLLWSTLKQMFLARSHGRHVDGQQYVWPEWGAYIGPILLTLALVGIIAGGLENAWIVALLVYSFLLMMGHEDKLAPWSILKAHIFPFKEMRVPSRFRCEVTLFLAALVGISLDRLPRMLQRWLLTKSPGAVRGLIVALALVGVGDMIGVGWSWFENTFQNAPAVPVPASARLFYGGPNVATMIEQPEQNRGRLQCWDEWGLYAGAPLWEGDVPQARAPGATIEVANRTQNTFTIDVSSPGPTTVLVNSSFDYGWRTNVGVVGEQNKQLVVHVPTGHHHVVLKYWPRWFTLGIALNVLGVELLAVFVWWTMRRARRSSRSS
jgi:hypothetical protein